MTPFLQSVSLAIASLDAARRVSAGIAEIRHRAGVVSVGRSSGATASETRIPSSSKHVRILRSKRFGSKCSVIPRFRALTFIIAPKASHSSRPRFGSVIKLNIAFCRSESGSHFAFPLSESPDSLLVFISSACTTLRAVASTSIS